MRRARGDWHRLVGHTVSMDEKPPTPTRQSTVSAIAERSGRPFIPIRREFVQVNRGPGPLATFVRNGDQRGLCLYLLVLTACSSAPFDVALPGSAWGRALGLDPSQQRVTAAVSKVWSRLEDRNLIERGRSGRWAQVTLLREDGSGRPYTRPDGKAKADRFFKVPHELWLDRWYERLDLPGMAVLLIARSLRPGFYLPQERAPEWYGISPETAGRGFAELQDVGLIEYVQTFKTAPLSPVGYTEQRQYTLKGAFSQAGQK